MTENGSPAVRLLIADVDGTLVTSEKKLTQRSIDAVAGLRDAGIDFAITSGRPPRGMEMLVEPLALSTPIAAFNGGEIVRPDMGLLEARTIPDELSPQITSMLDAEGLEVWLYRGADWYVRNDDAPHIARESFTVQFGPSVVESFDGLCREVAKIVGVSDDHERIAAATDAAQERFGAQVSASRSQPYYLDITHPRANKGEVAKFHAERLGIAAAQIATIGDMPNDVLMFAHSGLSIAMGQSDREVQRAARLVTSSNDEEGFANAVERFILGPLGTRAHAASAEQASGGNPAERS